MGKLRFSLLTVGVEALGNWNPQLMREIQGQFKLRSVVLTVLFSLVGQGLFLFWQYRTLDIRLGSCATAEFQKTGKKCIQAGTHYILVNWLEWWLQVFAWSCILMMFGLVVGGTFMLISDLSKEDRQGTLTFIGLSPQTAPTILMGKMLGVPLLIYLVVFLALPLHYAAGLAAQIPATKIFSFDLLLLASCFFYYSLALLLGLVGNWLNGFQSWLGSAGVLMLLLLLKNNSITKGPVDWLYTFAPTVILPYVTNTLDHNSYAIALPFAHNRMLNWQWFTVPLGQSGLLVLLFTLANYGLWAGWLWQPLRRRFHNPHIPLLSKRESYWATACFIVCSLGFSVSIDPNTFSETNIAVLLLAHMLWFLLLIVLLLPHHQALEDWARFGGDDQSETGRMRWNRDLIWADNSPTWGAIAINLGIAGVPIMTWLLAFPEKERMAGIVGLLFNSTLILIFTLFNQVMLLRPIANRNLWATATLLGPAILPTVFLAILGVNPGHTGGSLILLTPFAFVAIENTAVVSAIQMFMLHLGAVAGLIWQLKRQLKSLGESTTQRLLRGDMKVEQS